MTDLANVKALTFDVFGTVLDLGGSLTPYIADFLSKKGSEADPDHFWQQWRARQRLEQYQDTIMMLGHSGYLETARRAFVYTLGLNNVSASKEEVVEFMEAWKMLSPFPEVVENLKRLKTRFDLVVLSNGDPWFLDHLVENRIQWPFDEIISVTPIGSFKPHPAVYRGAAMRLGLEVGECMMISANSFDIVGARACGLRGAFVNRYDLPYEDTVFQPDVTVTDFVGLADALLT
ncbi:MAG: haloacid dehalogenase type II [Chloroflexota bacterium]